MSLIKLSAKPSTIIYPYPIAALLAFSLSGTYDIVLLLKAIAFSFIFYAGVNLWNHVNDVDEDIKGGKKTVITENLRLRNKFAIIPASLYVISFFLAILWSVDGRGIVAFAAAAFVTWVYSDRIFIGKKIRRWKDHYITETLAFVIFFPAFFSMLWTIFAPLSLRSAAFLITLTFFMLSVVSPKDIKDITGDSLAGLKTLGVVFSPESLLKTSFLMLAFYYTSILVFSILRIFPLFSVLSTLFFIGVIYNIKHFLNRNWEITSKSVKAFALMYYSNLGSLISLIFLGFI